MARFISNPWRFYHSKAWKACRDSYLQLHPFCERCLMAGKYTPAEHVHHIIHLAEDNWQDARVALNHDNLQALCEPCHTAVHASSEKPRRWKVDELGRVVTAEGE